MIPALGVLWILSALQATLPEPTARPNTADAAFDNASHRAEQARQAGRLDEAIQSYREAVAAKPSWTEGWWHLGALNYELGRYADARVALLRFVELDRRSGPGRALLGLCEYETGEYERSLTHLREAPVLGFGNNRQIQQVATYHTALLYTRAGQFEAAMDIVSRLVREEQETPAVIEAAGLAALRKPLLPADLPDADREIVMLAGRASFLALGRHEADAQKAFEELCRRYPDSPHVHYIYGSFLLTSNPDAAVAELRKELDARPKHFPALLQLAFEYLNRGDAAAALPYAEQAVQVDSQSFAARTVLGRVLVESGDLARGIRELQTAKQLAPDSPETRVALASAYAKAGRGREAAAERAEFLRLRTLAR